MRDHQRQLRARPLSNVWNKINFKEDFFFININCIVICYPAPLLLIKIDYSLKCPETNWVRFRGRKSASHREPRPSPTSTLPSIKLHKWSIMTQYARKRWKRRLKCEKFLLVPAPKSVSLPRNHHLSSQWWFEAARSPATLTIAPLSVYLFKLSQLIIAL